MTSQERSVSIGCWPGVAVWLVLPAAGVTLAPTVTAVLGEGGGSAGLITQDTEKFISGSSLLDGFIYLV